MSIYLPVKFINMKRIFFATSVVIIVMALLVIVFVKFYEKRLIQTFKSEIIDNTDLNLDFSEIHFSIIKNFPYGSFILDDALIFYSKPSRNDTLISTKKLCFKINAIDLFRNVYDFPEIIIYDGLLNIDIDKISRFLPESEGNQNESGYIVKTKSIKIVRCKVTYTQKKDIKLSMFIDNSKFSGSFLSKAIALNIELNIYQLSADIFGYEYKTKNLITIKSTLNERDKSYFCENATINVGSMNFNLSFLYNKKSELLQITSSSGKLNAKKFNDEFFPSLKNKLIKGDLLLSMIYSNSFKKEFSQSLTLKYSLENANVSGIKELIINKLEGNTSFSNNLKANNSEIKFFDINYRGIVFTGKSRIKNLPKPIVLIDGGVNANGDIMFSKDFSISGSLDGSIKVLAKIKNINTFELNDINIKRFNSQLKLSDVSITGLNYLKNLSGNVNINDNSFLYKGRGKVYNEDFEGTCVFNNFLTVAFGESSFAPSLNIEMDKINIDDVFRTDGISDSTNRNFNLYAKIGNVSFRDAKFSDFRFSLKAKKGDYYCENFSFNAFSGSLAGNFKFTENDSNTLNIVGQGVNINRLFKEFKNFKQSFITDKNLFGSVSGKVTMKYKTSKIGKIDIQSIRANSDIIIENGKLIGLSQLKRVSKFLNLNEMDSIRFKTLQNRIEISNGMIKIPSMVISSSALNFRIAGEHNFKNEFTYWMKVNLNDVLAKKFKLNRNNGADIEFDSRDGLNLYLKLFGNSDKYQIVYDRKKNLEKFKTNLNQEGQLLKTIIKEEFSLTKNKSKDTSLGLKQNLIDSSNNKTGKKPFKIEWDEIDTSKVNNL